MTRAEFVRQWSDRLIACIHRGYYSSDPPDHKFRRMQAEVAVLETELGKLFDSLLQQTQPPAANGKPATSAPTVLARTGGK